MTNGDGSLRSRLIGFAFAVLVVAAVTTTLTIATRSPALLPVSSPPVGSVWK